MQTADLFAPADASPTPVAVVNFYPSLKTVAVTAPPADAFPAGDLDAMIDRAESTLMRVLQSQRSVVCSWSAGKDSSCVLNLLLSAAAKLAATGAKLPPIVVQHADTLIENPEMRVYARNEMTAVRAFAQKHGIGLSITIASPSLADSWAVRTIGGRSFAPHPSANVDCTMDWKARPMERMTKALMKKLQPNKDALEPVILLGTRYEESAERAAKMRERGESDMAIRRGTKRVKKTNKTTGAVEERVVETHLYLSPICFWTVDDVWELLGRAKSGALLAYSDFIETFRVYQDAMGTSCVIVGEDMVAAQKRGKSGGCGARHGCAVCTRVGKDKSMENMLASESGRYTYMSGLNRLRNFLFNIHFDYDRRTWFGRTIEKDHIRIAPDGYSPATVEELLHYALTLDVEEQEASAQLGIAPRFQLVSLPALFGIDANWSLQAFHRPYHALAIWRDIVQDGKRYPIPDVPEYKKPKAVPVRYLYTGPDWNGGRSWDLTGMRNVVLEAVRHDGDGCMGTVELRDGRRVLDVETADSIEIDEEACHLFMEFEFDRAMAEHDAPAFDPTAAYHHYLLLGLLAIHPAGRATYDDMLRRASFKTRYGFAGQLDHKALLAKTVSAEEAGIKETSNGRKRKRGADGSKSVLFEDLSVPAASAPVATMDELQEAA